MPMPTHPVDPAASHTGRGRLLKWRVTSETYPVSSIDCFSALWVESYCESNTTSATAQQPPKFVLMALHPFRRN